jgi:hypothetical protein
MTPPVSSCSCRVIGRDCITCIGRNGIATSRQGETATLCPVFVGCPQHPGGVLATPPENSGPVSFRIRRSGSRKRRRRSPERGPARRATGSRQVVTRGLAGTGIGHNLPPSIHRVRPAGPTIASTMPSHSPLLPPPELLERRNRRGIRARLRLVPAWRKTHATGSSGVERSPNLLHS